MARGPQAGRLGLLERQLAAVDRRRTAIIAQMKLAIGHLTLGSAAPLAGIDLGARVGPRRSRRMSAAHRAKLSAAAKARWAKAKKAGKNRLD